MRYSALSHLECPRCGRRHDADRIVGRCGCGSPVLARYDLPAIGAGPKEWPGRVAGRAPTMWRYHELLPVRAEENVVTLGEGMTPLVPLPRLGAEIGVPGLVMKDEGVLPGGTFKTRGAAAGVSRARELGARGIAMPTNGNAGAAWALYCARAGLRSLIAMPLDAPEITRRECRAAGADLRLVAGHIGTAAQTIAAELAEPTRGARSSEASLTVEVEPNGQVEPGEATQAVAATRETPEDSGAGGYVDASTLKEPYRIEGKKTMGFEIAEQLGWRAPDVIVYPTGGGVGIIGIHKALTELRAAEVLTGKMPRLVAVQAAGCAPIVRAFDEGADESTPWQDPHTIAYGINVPKALGDFLVLEAVRESGGRAIAVDDETIMEHQARAARLEGAFICPEGAATLAATRRLRDSGWIAADDEVVVLNTGTGLKYPQTFPI